jgi:cardiolipin synthase
MEGVVELAASLGPTLLGVLSVVVALVTTAHVVVNKRDVRSAIAWVGLVWLAPILGSALYVLLGVNRIRRTASALDLASHQRSSPAAVEPTEVAALVAALGEDHAPLASLARLSERVVRKPLLGGNTVTPLRDGDEAYPAMLAAIDAAERSIALSSYIFDSDREGRRFVAALERAVKRGVEVRVLIDAIGTRYAYPPITRLLRDAGVRVATFLPIVTLTRIHVWNLRNHRKILVVDGSVGFTGGMNIREGCVLATPSDHPVQDLHFLVRGPVVGELVEAFAEDWSFATGEMLDGPAWFPSPEPVGGVHAKVVCDGPDDDLDVLRTLFLGAIACARHRLFVVTPYFLPDASILTALEIAALRGVDVRILLPERNNLRFVQWASTAQLWQVLHRGCHVHLGPPPFDHTKLLVVDGAYALVGSANWDPRSLRLNFELDLECWSVELARELESLVQRKLASSREITLADVDGRPRWMKVRDGVARLFSPYL